MVRDWLQRDTFRGRRVLVTGHTGFKGSWLAIWLARLRAKVSGYALPPPTTPSNFVVSNVRRLLENNVTADIRDGACLDEAFEQIDPEIVFHLAAQPLVRASYALPHETFEINMLGTAAVLDAVRRRNKPCVVVVVTSDKCYENREQVWGYRETDPLGGHDPYSASKAAAEILVASYRRSFFSPERLHQHHVKLATVRAGNVIGGGDWAGDRIVPDAVRHLVAGVPIPVRNPRAVRPWQHVLESLSGYLTLAAKMCESDDPRWCEAWNFGPASGEELSVARLVEQFLAAWGDGAWTDVSAADQPHETAMLRLNIDKSRYQLGWRPRWTPCQAVERTAGWYRRYYESPHCRMLEACEEDIEAFESADDARIGSPPLSTQLSAVNVPYSTAVLQ